MSFDAAAASAGVPTQIGKGAIEGKYRSQIATSGAYSFSHSIDVDAFYAVSEPQSPRWDYGVGVRNGTNDYAIWIEPHGATSSSEVDRVISKLNWLKEKMRCDDWSGLRALTIAAGEASLQPYWWLVPGTVSFSPSSPAAKKLAAAGIKMPVKKVTIR